jgi:hypothetical protein
VTFHDDVLAIVEPWHNYKHEMHKDTDLKIVGGELRSTVNVQRFQERLNTASKALLAKLESSDYDLVTSLVEVAANARSIMDLDRAKG